MLSSNEKKEFVFSLYVKNPKFVTEIITTKTNGEDFSNLSIKETLDEIDIIILEDIYIQLNSLIS